MRNWFANVLEIFRKKRRASYEITNYVSITIVRDYKAISNIDYEEEIDETFEHHKRSQSESLPNGWIWTDYDDGSGGLESPNGDSYFSYDIDTKEYKIKDNDHWNLFNPYTPMILGDFKAFAEEYIKKEILKKGEKDEIRISVLRS